ncbi:MAG: hypothetical protein MMC23_009150 [Stictis urceolatum]|nr:hypothetical protein [Stictis urceolata]
MLEPDRTVDYYKIIGCEPMDDDASIKKAYRALDTERFKEINEAHEFLMDPERRFPYDAARAKDASPAARSRKTAPTAYPPPPPTARKYPASESLYQSDPQSKSSLPVFGLRGISWQIQAKDSFPAAKLGKRRAEWSTAKPSPGSHIPLYKTSASRASATQSPQKPSESTNAKDADKASAPDASTGDSKRFQAATASCSNMTENGDEKLQEARAVEETDRRTRSANPNVSSSYVSLDGATSNSTHSDLLVQECENENPPSQQASAVQDETTAPATTFVIPQQPSTPQQSSTPEVSRDELFNLRKKAKLPIPSHEKYNKGGIHKRSQTTRKRTTTKRGRIINPEGPSLSNVEEEAAETLSGSDSGSAMDFDFDITSPDPQEMTGSDPINLEDVQKNAPLDPSTVSGLDHHQDLDHALSFEAQTFTSIPSKIVDHALLEKALTVSSPRAPDSGQLTSEAWSKYAKSFEHYLQQWRKSQERVLLHITGRIDQETHMEMDIDTPLAEDAVQQYSRSLDEEYTFRAF